MTPPSSAAPLTAANQIDSSKLTRNQKSVVALVIMGNISEFFDIFLIGFVVSLLVKPWHLTGGETGIILACSGLGTVAGAILWGRLADKLGRKGSFSWCIIMLVVFTALCLLTPNNHSGWWLLAILRIGVGIGVGGLNITSIPYVQEFVPAKQRGLLAGLASVFIPVGLLLGAQAQRWLAEPLGWRGLIALGILPVFLLFWLRKVPESPRFLQSHGRMKEAKEAYAWALMIPVDQVGELPVMKEKASASFATVFKHHMRPLTIITLGSFCFILGSFTIQSWGQTLLKDSFGYTAAMVGTLFTFVSLADIAGRLGSAWLSDIIGRRWVMFIFGMLGAAGCVIAALSTSGTMFFVGILIAMAFGDGAFGILNAFGAEQFSNDVRSTGLGLGYGIGATAKIFGPALMGFLIGGSVSDAASGGAVKLAFFLFAALLAAGGVVYLFARETKALQLEKIS